MLKPITLDKHVVYDVYLYTIHIVYFYDNNLLELVPNLDHHPPMD